MFYLTLFCCCLLFYSFFISWCLWRHFKNEIRITNMIAHHKHKLTVIEFQTNHYTHHKIWLTHETEQWEIEKQQEQTQEFFRDMYFTVENKIIAGGK